MKKSNSLAILTALVFLFTIPSAFAKKISDQELVLAFGSQLSPQKVAALSQQEMRETEGSYGWWGAAAGFTTAAVTYGSYAYGSGSWSWSGFRRAAAIGTLSGFVLPTPTAINFTHRTAVGGAAGYSVGWASSWF